MKSLQNVCPKVLLKCFEKHITKEKCHEAARLKSLDMRSVALEKLFQF